MQGAPSCASALGRAGAALAVLKLYRTGLMIAADLADTRAARARAHHGDGDPVVAVLQEMAKCNRAAKQGLDECAAAADAHFLAQLHSAAVCVVGATASYAESARHMGEFARRFTGAAVDGGHGAGSRAHHSAHRAPSAHRAHHEGCAATQLVQFWRMCILYSKIALSTR